MKILFFGSSDYCLSILESLHKHFELVGVITRPDKEIGRKKILTPSHPKIFAEKNNIKLFTPNSKIALLHLKSELNSLQTDVAVVADFGLIIPKEIFALPKKQTLNIHFSPLPLLRGASPVQFTILSGEETAWITIIRMDETMDTGDIVWSKEYPLTQKETTKDLYFSLFQKAAEELPQVVTKYSNSELQVTSQDHSKATYTRRLSREDGFVPFVVLRNAMQGISAPNELKEWELIHLIAQAPKVDVAEIIDRAVRAFSPWPGVWSTFQDKDNVTKRLKILKTHIENQKLVLDEVQLEGKLAVSGKQFFDNYPTLFKLDP